MSSSENNVALANLSRAANGTFFYGELKQIHATETKATAEIATATGPLVSPFLPVSSRKKAFLNKGERVLLIAPQGKIEQGFILCRKHDPEQDMQNKRLDELERRVDAIEPLAHSH